MAMVIQIDPDALYVPLKLPANLFHIDADALFDLCQANDLFRFEQNANGDVLVQPLNGGTAACRTATFTAQLVLWNRDERDGVAFGSMVGFVLPNGVMRSPGAAWVRIGSGTPSPPNNAINFLPLLPTSWLNL